MEFKQSVLKVLNTAGVDTLNDPEKFSSVLFDVSHGMIPDWEYIYPIVKDQEFIQCFVEAKSADEILSSLNNAKQVISRRPLNEDWMNELCNEFASAVGQYYGVGEDVIQTIEKEEIKDSSDKSSVSISSSKQNSNGTPSFLGLTSIRVWACLCLITLCWMFAPIAYGEGSFSVLEILISAAIIVAGLVLLPKAEDQNRIIMIGVEFMVINYQFGWALVTISNFYGHYALLTIFSMLAWILGSVVVVMGCVGVMRENHVTTIRHVADKNKAQVKMISLTVVVLVHILAMVLMFMDYSSMGGYAPTWLCFIGIVFADLLLIMDQKDKYLFEGLFLSFVIGLLIIMLLSFGLFHLPGISDGVRRTFEPIANHLIIPNVAVVVALCMKNFFKIKLR